MLCNMSSLIIYNQNNQIQCRYYRYSYYTVSRKLSHKSYTALQSHTASNAIMDKEGDEITAASEHSNV
jgi:hypothetical protein